MRKKGILLLLLTFIAFNFTKPVYAVEEIRQEVRWLWNDGTIGHQIYTTNINFEQKLKNIIMQPETVRIISIGGVSIEDTQWKAFSGIVTHSGKDYSGVYTLTPVVSSQPASSSSATQQAPKQSASTPEKTNNVQTQQTTQPQTNQEQNKSLINQDELTKKYTRNNEDKDPANKTLSNNDSTQRPSQEQLKETGYWAWLKALWIKIVAFFKRG